jgi:predicted 3-demethylubiquinone-9 3-methyltransferase (glyoxalase superfamily)
MGRSVLSSFACPKSIKGTRGGKINSPEVPMNTFDKTTRITPFLWYDNNAEEAVEFYLSVFNNSRRITELRSAVDTSVPKGAILTIGFEIDGQYFTAINGGPGHPFNDAVSFVVRCETQQEIDEYWAKLTADGGSEVACGWLKDKYGLRWQIVPAHIFEWVGKPTVMNAVMKMKKLDIAELERAAKE